MLSVLALVCFLGSVGWLACVLLAWAQSTYLKCAAGFGLFTVANIGGWVLAAPLMSDAAGLGVFFIAIALEMIALAASVVAAAVAAVRHVISG